MQFLDQEVQPLADLAASAQQAFDLVEVGRQPRQLLGHVDADREGGGLVERTLGERLLHKGGEVGKRLDFLIQELQREANTLGSKSAALELTSVSVEMKVLIEQMLEQVQNIE